MVSLYNSFPHRGKGQLGNGLINYSPMEKTVNDFRREMAFLRLSHRPIPWYKKLA